MIYRSIVLRDKSHDVGHYAALGAKTMLVYGVFIASLFSVPAAKFVAEHVFAKTVGRGVIGETAITLEVLDSERGRVQGLSGRQSLPLNHALLFIFDTADYHGIWMKDMKFAIDILWLNEYSEVIHIERNVRPETYPDVFTPSKPARYVIELNAGFVNKNAIRMGDRFTLLGS